MKHVIYRQLQALGAPGVIGLGVFVFAAVFHLSWHQPLQAEVRQMERRSVASRTSSTVPASDRALAVRLDALLRDLPPEDTLADQVKTLHAIAARHGVVLQKGGYDLVWESAGRIGRQRVALQSHAPYHALRAFLREALAAQPTLALEEVAFSRRQAAETVLEAALVLTYHVAATNAPERHAPAHERSATSGTADLFGAPAARMKIVSEAPKAPPLPFGFVGRYVESGMTHVFLEQGAQLHMVKVGDTIDDLYRIERIDKDIQMTYLPLKERQTLTIGDTP